MAWIVRPQKAKRTRPKPRPRATWLGTAGGRGHAELKRSLNTETSEPLTLQLLLTYLIFLNFPSIILRAISSKILPLPAHPQLSLCQGREERRARRHSSEPSAPAYFFKESPVTLACKAGHGERPLARPLAFGLPQRSLLCYLLFFFLSSNNPILPSASPTYEFYSDTQPR